MEDQRRCHDGIFDGIENRKIAIKYCYITRYRHITVPLLAPAFLKILRMLESLENVALCYTRSEGREAICTLT